MVVAAADGEVPVAADATKSPVSHRGRLATRSTRKELAIQSRLAFSGNDNSPLETTSGGLFC
jgi:hypothetical protein